MHRVHKAELLAYWKVVTHRNNSRVPPIIPQDHVPPRPIVLISNIYYRVFCLTLTWYKLYQTMRFFSRNCEIGFCSYMPQHFLHIGIELCLPFCSLGVQILLLVMGNETRALDIMCTHSTTKLSPVFHIKCWARLFYSVSMLYFSTVFSL